MINKSGSLVLFYGLMLGLAIIVLALALAPAIKEQVDTAMNNTNGDTLGLDCDNNSISNYDKATCVVADASSFYFIGGLIFIAGTVITAKIYFG